MPVFCIVTLAHTVSSRRHNIMTKRKETKRSKNMFDTESCIL